MMTERQLYLAFGVVGTTVWVIATAWVTPATRWGWPAYLLWLALEMVSSYALMRVIIWRLYGYPLWPIHPLLPPSAPTSIDKTRRIVIPDLDECTFTCHVCGLSRPDERISVWKHAHLVHGGAVAGCNVRYCNDSQVCAELAREYCHAPATLGGRIDVPPEEIVTNGRDHAL